MSKAERFLTIYLKIILFLMVIGYLAINLATTLPLFLIGENLLYAIGYGLGLLWITRNGKKIFYNYLSVVSSFNLGRLSRSIVEPTGEIAPLAFAHLPLFFVILLDNKMF